MLAMQHYFAKSLEEDHATKTLVGKTKKVFQTLENIVATKIIKPNTKSFGQERRLSTTLLHENYAKTYRPQGIIFETRTKPDYIMPFDLVLLSNAKEIAVHYYRIKNNLHTYYNHKLIPGHEQFLFKNIEAMLHKYSSPQIVWHELNAFRMAHGHKLLPRSKYRLVEYNEAVFIKPVKIKLVALFGYRKQTKVLAKRFGLKYFRSAKAFFEWAHEQKNI